MVSLDGGSSSVNCLLLLVYKQGAVLGSNVGIFPAERQEDTCCMHMQTALTQKDPYAKDKHLQKNNLAERSWIVAGVFEELS